MIRGKISGDTEYKRIFPLAPVKIYSDEMPYVKEIVPVSNANGFPIQPAAHHSSDINDVSTGWSWFKFRGTNSTLPSVYWNSGSVWEKTSAEVIVFGGDGSSTMVSYITPFIKDAPVSSKYNWWSDDVVTGPWASNIYGWDFKNGTAYHSVRYSPYAIVTFESPSSSMAGHGDFFYFDCMYDISGGEPSWNISHGITPLPKNTRCTKLQEATKEKNGTTYYLTTWLFRTDKPFKCMETSIRYLSYPFLVYNMQYTYNTRIRIHFHEFGFEMIKDK